MLPLADPGGTDLEKNDGRLYPEYPLYCEGLQKPICRGLMHLMCTILLPFGMWHLVIEANDDPVGIATAILYVGSNIWCYGFSALYHVGTWSPKTEILLQKLDHCGIALLSVGTFMPCTWLLFPAHVAALFTLMLVSTCAWTCWSVRRCRPSLLAQVSVPLNSLLFVYYFAATLSSMEFTCFWIVVALKLCGVVVFVRMQPDPFPTVFGYHEVFHLFVSLAGATVYLCNWSIIRRACNPYAHNTDVWIDVMAMLARVWD